MNKLSKEKRDQLILVGFGTIAAVLAIWFLLISSQKRTLLDTRDKTAKAQAKVANAEKALKSGTTIDEDLTAKLRELKSIEETMAYGDMYSWVITTLNRFTAGHKVAIPLFSREVVGEVGMIPKFPYKAATFQLKGSAFYHDFGKFLADFENSFPYVRVQNLEFMPGTAGDDKEKLDVKFEIVTLIKPTGS